MIEGIPLLKKNIRYTFLSRIWIILINVATLPYIISKLGPNAYGVLVIINTILGYLSFLDFGIVPTIIKFAGEEHAKNNFRELQKTIENLLLLSMISGILGGFVLYFASGALVNHILKIPVDLRGLTTTCFQISSVGFLLRMILTALTSIPASIQRIDITSLLAAVMQTAAVLLQVSLLYLGKGIFAIVLAELFLNGVGILISYVIAYKLIPAVKLLPALSMQTVKKMASFGLLTWLQNLLGLIFARLDKFLINIFLSVAWVTYYSIPSTVVQGISSTLDILGGSYYPAACRLAAKQDKNEFMKIYSLMTKYSILSMAVLFLPILLFPHFILSLWLGKSFADKSSTVFQILALAQLILSLPYVDTLCARALGKPKILVQYTLLSVILNVTLNFFLIPKLGITGASIAVLIPAILVPALFMLQFRVQILNPYLQGRLHT